MINLDINNKEEYQTSKDLVIKLNNWRDRLISGIKINAIILVVMPPLLYSFGLKHLIYNTLINLFLLIIFALIDSVLSTHVLKLQMEQLSFLIKELPEVNKYEI